MNKKIISSASLFIAMIAVLAYAASWNSGYIAGLSGGDCRGIASGDKSWCN